MKHMHDKKNNGFTFIEVIIVMIILSLSFLTFLQALNTGKTVRARSELRTVQSVIMNSIQNQIRARKFDEGSGPTWTTPNSLGKDGNETNLSDFDDIDDFHLYSENEVSEHPGFGISVSVTYADLGSGFNVPDPNQQTDFKRVTVTVSHETISDMTDIMVIGAGL